MKEEKRRQVLHRNRIELLGEETAKKFQEEDYEQDQELLVQILEKIAKRENPEPQHQRKRLRESKGLREAKVRTWVRTYIPKCALKDSSVLIVFCFFVFVCAR